MEKQKLPRNVKIVAVTSFLTDVSSEMVINTLPLFLKNVLGVKTSIIGLIEGVAESISSFLRLFSGWFSDRLQKRKLLAVVGYGISALFKPLFYFAHSWEVVAAARWGDRIGKGVRTAPRDALVADSTPPGAARLRLRFPPRRRYGRRFLRPGDRPGHRLVLPGRQRRAAGGHLPRHRPGQPAAGLRRR